MKKQFPALLNFEDRYLKKAGYEPLRVSVFDHWMTEEETKNCDVLTFDVAVKRNKLSEYEKGELKLLSLYLSMWPVGPVFSVLPIKELDRSLFRRVVTESLRERKLMDLWFESLEIRVVGGYDRTDLLLLHPSADEVRLRRAIYESGLYILT